MTKNYVPSQENQFSVREKKKVAYTLRTTTHVSSSGEFNPDSTQTQLMGGWAAPMTLPEIKGQITDVFYPDCFLSEGISFDPTCSVRMEILQQNSWSGWQLLGAVVGGATWGLFPCGGDDKYTLQVRVSNRAGKEKVYLVSGQVTTLVWLPAIIAMPSSKLPNERLRDLSRELWKELRIRMINDGFFDYESASPIMPVQPVTQVVPQPIQQPVVAPVQPVAPVVQQTMTQPVVAPTTVPAQPVAQSVQPPPSSSTDMAQLAQKIQTLKKLYQTGVLSKEEYEKALDRLLQMR